MNRSLTPVVAAPLLFLAACEEEPATDAGSTETGGRAAGEVLGGTISDDMIPLEELTSTSPPAERSAASTPSSGSAPAPAASAEPQLETPEVEAPSDAPASEPVDGE